MIKVTENVYVETGMLACNAGLLVAREGVVMIDGPMRPSDAIKWHQEAQSRGEIKYVISTEEHADHWAGSYFFPGVLISHQITRDKLSSNPIDQVLTMANRVDPGSLSLLDNYRVRLADITFGKSMTLYLGEHKIELFHLPGHSSGGIGVYLPDERVVFASDIVFYKKKSWLHEADPAQWLFSLETLASLDVDVIVPGHGELCKKDYLDEQASIIREWLEATKSMVARGLTIEEAQMTIKVPDPYPKQEGTPMTATELDNAIVRRLYLFVSTVHFDKISTS
jgi:cyclase